MATKPTDTEDVQIIKKKGKPRGGNSPVIGDNGLMVQEGDNSKLLGFTMKVGYLSKIDIRNVEQVDNRIQEYFTLCFENDMKPAVSGLALALGVSRQTLWAIKNNQPMGGNGNLPNMPPDVTDLIKKAYLLMENLWENYMQNGKINPVSGIFLGKNNFGYQDKTEYVVTPNVQQDNNYDPDSIRQRYLIDSADSEED